MSDVAADEFVRLEGSEPRSIKGMLVTGLATLDQVIDVTIVFYPAGQPSAGIVAGLPGADPKAMGMLEDFACKNGLTVIRSSGTERRTILRGTIRAFSAAFRVEIVSCTLGQQSYRTALGCVFIPKVLANAVMGVFGLDNLPTARPE